MPDTGERREITRFVNAKEAETVQHSNTIVSRTRQKARVAGQQELSRKERKRLPPSNLAKRRKVEEVRQDREGSERMADEGGPTTKP
jgi:hypothetical protein